MAALYTGLILLLFLMSSYCTTSVMSTGVSVSNCDQNPTPPPSQISANLDTLVANLASNASKNRYSLGTFGKGRNQVYGLAQCRGDVNTTDCRTCIQQEADLRTFECQNQTSAWRWSEDNCFIRFDTRNFFGTFERSWNFSFPDIAHPQHPSAFKKQLDALMGKIISQAIVPASQGFAKGKSFSAASNATIYGVAQCTRDLSVQTCAGCLNTAYGIDGVCRNKKTTGCRIYASSCYLRYDIQQIYYPLS